MNSVGEKFFFQKKKLLFFQKNTIFLVNLVISNITIKI